MKALLDVNVVIALLDPLHVQHERAHEWFASRRGDTWHTCPTVQNGVVRIVSNHRYGNAQPAATVLASVKSLTELEGHVFIADDVSLLDAEVDRTRLLASKQITDTFLLLMATRHDARLATFDRKLATTAVARGSQHLEVIT